MALRSILCARSQALLKALDAKVDELTWLSCPIGNLVSVIDLSEEGLHESVETYQCVCP